MPAMMHTGHMVTGTTPAGSEQPAWSRGLALLPFAELKNVKGVVLPADVRFRQIVATGPPGAGKSHFIRKLGGWPEEGYIDLTLKNWWRAQPLTLRPREVNLGFPFVGHDRALTVFDEEFLEAAAPLEIDGSRVLFPPPRRHILSPNWRGRFAFFFLVPPARRMLAGRLTRASEGVHPVDENVTLAEVERQLDLYHQAAVLFHLAEMTTCVIDDFDAAPKYLSSAGQVGQSVSGRDG